MVWLHWERPNQSSLKFWTELGIQCSEETVEKAHGYMLLRQDRSLTLQSHYFEVNRRPLEERLLDPEPPEAYFKKGPYVCATSGYHFYRTTIQIWVEDTNGVVNGPKVLRSTERYKECDKT